MRQSLCRLQDPPGPGINRNFALKCFPIDSRNIAVRMVKTHFPVHPGDDIERAIYSVVQSCFVIASSGDFDKRAESGTGPPHSI
jgi:hypothetical protein